MYSCLQQQQHLFGNVSLPDQNTTYDSLHKAKLLKEVNVWPFVPGRLYSGQCLCPNICLWGLMPVFDTFLA